MISEAIMLTVTRWMLGLLALVPIGMLIAGGYLGMPWWMTIILLVVAADILSSAVYQRPLIRGL